MKATSKAMLLSGFIPALVIQQLYNNKNQKISLPYSQTFNTVVMFADISGFTNLTENLSKKGNEGCELTAFAINRYMELLVKSISRSGGDIFKYAGDAMIVVWPPPKSDQSPEIVEEQLKLLCRQAIQSALDIQSKLNNTLILENIQLSVKIGFGIGEVTVIYVGGVLQRAEYLATGKPLQEAFECEHYSTKGGQIIVSKNVKDKVENVFEFSEVNDKGFYFVNKIKIGQKVKMKADALLIKSTVNLKQILEIEHQLVKYIPAAIRQYVDVDCESWGSQLRLLTIMFVNLGIDLSDAATKQGIAKIQNVIEIVQKSIYIFEGSLNKLLMDDKGSTLIAVFGLPPLSHTNDACRVVLCSKLIQDRLQLIDCKCAIGISTGVVFAGVIGTSGSRREFSVLGDAVNLSARLMQLACNQVDINKRILLCSLTGKLCSERISVEYWQNFMFKGKQNSIPVFLPNYSPLCEGIEKIKQKQNLNAHELKDSIIIGCKKIIQQISDHLNKFNSFENDEKMLIITGESGVGKSMILKRALQYSKLPITIVQQAQINNCLSDCNMFGMILKQIKELIHADIILPKCLNSAQSVFDEFPNSIQKQGIQMDIYKELKKTTLAIFELYFKENQQLLIVIDSLEDLDIYSNKLLKSLLKRFNSLYLIATLNSQCQDQFLLNSQIQKKIIKVEFKKSQEDIFRSILLIEFGISKILLQNIDEHEYSPSEQFILQETKRRWSMVRNQNKDPFLLEQNLEHIHEMRVECWFVQYLMSKTNCNPLSMINLMSSLISAKQIAINYQQQLAIISLDLMNSIQMDELITIPCPLNLELLNNQIIDTLNPIERIIMQVAGVLGQTFDIQALTKINPLQQLESNEIFQILCKLQQQDYLQVMEQTSSNIFYRFSASFMRETLYNRLLFSQRRKIHSNIANLYQIAPSYQIDILRDIKILDLHWKLGQEQLQSQISDKAKRSLLVKYTKSILDQNKFDNKTVIKREYMILDQMTVICELTVINLKIFNIENKKKPIYTIGLKYISLVHVNQDEGINQFSIYFTLYYQSTNTIESLHLNLITPDEMSLDEWVMLIDLTKTIAIYEQFTINFGKIQFPLNQVGEYQNSDIVENLSKLNAIHLNLKEDNNNNQRIKFTNMFKLQSTEMLIGSPKNAGLRVSHLMELTENKIQLLKKQIHYFFKKAYLIFVANLLEGGSNRVYGQKTKFEENEISLFEFEKEFRFSQEDDYQPRKTYIVVQEPKCPRNRHNSIEDDLLSFKFNDIVLEQDN